MSETILIVDDEPNVRLSYRVALETEGYVVKEAHCGARALDELAANSFDLAILDMRMPEMDGLQLLAEMRRRGYSTPTVIITAFGDVPHAVRAMKLGAIDFLKKPITPGALRKVVEEVVARHQTCATPAKPLRDDFQAHIVSAKWMLNLQYFPQAKRHLVRALELNDRSAEALNLTGVFFEMQEDYERAKRYYAQAIKLDSHYEPAQQNMRHLSQRSSKDPIALGLE